MRATCPRMLQALRCFDPCDPPRTQPAPNSPSTTTPNPMLPPHNVLLCQAMWVPRPKSPKSLISWPAVHLGGDSGSHCDFAFRSVVLHPRGKTVALLLTRYHRYGACAQLFGTEQESAINHAVYARWGIQRGGSRGRCEEAGSLGSRPAGGPTAASRNREPSSAHLRARARSCSARSGSGRDPR